MNRGTIVVNSLPKTITRQRRGCDLNPVPSAPESSTLTTRLPSHPLAWGVDWRIGRYWRSKRKKLMTVNSSDRYAADIIARLQGRCPIA